MKRFGSVSEALREIASCDLSPSAEVKVVAAQQRAYDATSQNMVDIEVLPLQHPVLLSYLHTRKIDKEIGCMYCREIHYKIYNKSYFAIAFGNVSGGYEVRNPYFKGCFGNKDITLIPHTFNECQSGCLVFEGFMDFLSFLTLTKKQDKIFAIERKCDYIILNSVYNLKRCLRVLDRYASIHCFLDNDIAGQKTVETIRGLYEYQVTDASFRYADYKDLNDYLLGRKM